MLSSCGFGTVSIRITDGAITISVKYLWCFNVSWIRPFAVDPYFVASSLFLVARRFCGGRDAPVGLFLVVGGLEGG